ncbi:hypothetical protein GCM10009839_13550 [Catenulispora yoronensis]|uniref:DUF1023 domain-containing protein n=1 Tax=Catenulispora yoronensis TaxID=450799 RepID=A0ABN2TRK1_9ACTN
MAQPTDWRILGFDSVPIPQDPDDLHTWARMWHDYADEIARAQAGTTGLLADPAITGWMGRSGQAFKDACAPFPGMLGTAETAYRSVGDAWDDLSKQVRTLQGQLDGYWNQANALLQKMRADGGLSEEDALTCATADSDARMVELMKSSHMETRSSLGQDGFLNALDALSASRLALEPLRAKMPNLYEQYTGAKAKCENTINDATDLASRILKSAGGTGAKSMDFDQRFAALGGSVADLVLNPDAALGLEDAMFPGPGSDSSEVSWWWASLSQAERDQLIKEHADIVGALNGIPCADRDKANRSVLASQLTSVQDRLKVLDASQPDKDTDGADWDKWNAERNALKDQLKGLQAIDARLHDQNGMPPAFLIGLDRQGLGHAIVAINNPDTANNVITYVPGTTARLGTIGADISRSDRMVGSANDASNGTQVTSSITWVGYDAPQSIEFDSPFADYADAAEGKLRDFEAAIRTTHQGAPSLNTIIGHSYGTTAIGFAMRDYGLPVDRVVFVGSPGVGVDHASDLHIDPSRFWAGASANDPVPQLNTYGNAALLAIPIAGAYLSYLNDGGTHGGWFGQNPAAPEFGGQILPTANGKPVTDGGSHSQYWDPNSPSLKAIGQIVVGGTPHV